MKVLKIFLFIFLFFSVNFLVYSQKAPIKFGKPNSSDFDLTAYEGDTSASAIVLCDYGYFDANNFQFTRTLRIKILKKEGLSYGTQVFNVNDKANISGYCYNIENGKIIKTKLKSESIFKERVFHGAYRTRVAMPNVKVGSILDFETFYKDFPSEWYFQWHIPVKWSELIIESSPYISFSKNYQGYIPLQTENNSRWIAKNVPAFKSEPYMSSEDNFICKFNFDILNISVPGYYKEFATTWESIYSLFEKSDYFGTPLTTLELSSYLSDIAEKIKLTNNTPLDKAKAAYEAVKVEKWNKIESLETSGTGLNTAYNKRVGNSADINLMLTKLLRKLNINAYPVAISTRSNGIPPLFRPSYNKLNYVIVLAKIDTVDYLLDATETLLPFGLLPERDLNFKGRIFDKNVTGWVDLAPAKSYKQLVNYNLSLNPQNNSLNGTINYVKSDYAAYKFRTEYEKFNSQEEFIANKEKQNIGLEIDNAVFENIDSIYKPTKEIYQVKIKNAIEQVGDLLYLYPLLYEQTKENPFKLETRLYPVDFIYPNEKFFIINYTIPEDYEISQLPKSITLKLPDNSAIFKYQIIKNNKTITVFYRLIFTKTTYQTNEYADLQAFYTELVKKQAEAIVIKKTTTN